MDVNLPYVSLVFPVDKYDDRILRCFSSFLTYFKYRRIDNWIVVGNLNDKEEYIINDYSHKYGIRNLHIIKTGCNKSYEELSKIGISFGFNDSEICYVADFKTEITKEFNPGVLINILNREQNIRSIRLTGKDYKKIEKCKYKILNLTDRFSYDGNYLIKNGSGNDLIVDFKVDGIKSIEIKQIIKEEPKKSIIETKKPIIEQIPYVTVLMTTHNRTNVACAVIDSLIKNLKYPKLKWCISDDRSDEGHVEKLVEQFKKNGINEVHVEKTTKDRYGLGASLNNGLKYAWTNSDIVLTTEDDWILEKELKLAHYVDIINKNNDIGGIRLATMNYAIANKRSGHKGFYIVESDGKYKTSVFNNQVMLRHKRTYDKIGYYKENCSGDVSEIDEIKKFNNQKGLAVLYPDFIKQNCMDDSSMYFIHVGKSVSGHERYGVPERYQWIYDENRDLPYVTVVMTTHNRTHVACAVIDSLCKNLIYPKLKWCISDDRSDEGHVDRLLEQFKINGINDVHVERTTKDRYGLGASLNNGLKYAWTNSEYVLRIEDDWILERKLDIVSHVKILINEQSVDAIRLAYLDKKQGTIQFNSQFDRIIKSEFNYNFNNQVCICNKRIYDFLGDNPENCSAPEQETYMKIKYNKLTDCGNMNEHIILFENKIKRSSYDDSSLYFIHIGDSTLNHNYICPERYKIYNYLDKHNNKIIVTMTSWIKRIKNCSYIIKKILNNTLKPDILFLNLSTCEFPNREKDLPKELVDIIHTNNIFKINWVYGENTKSMKKVYPILKYINDDDMIIICDDDLDIPYDFVYIRVKEFIEHNCLFPISSGTNKKYHLDLPLYHTKYNSLAAGSIFSKKMLFGYDKIWKKRLIETYKDDTIHTMLCLSNGFYPIPSKYLSTLSGSTQRKIPFYNDICGMRENNMWASDDKTIKIFTEEYNKEFSISFQESLFNLVIWDSYDIAGDNGECFYRQIMNLYPSIKMTFILSKNSKDWSRLKSDNFNLYPFEGNDLEIILNNASYILWSKDIPQFNNVCIMKYLIKNRDKSIFIPHGITSRIYNCSPYLKGLSNYAKYMCCTSNDEAQVIIDYSDKKLIPIISGFPRHDIILSKLHNRNKNNTKQILISFHHRPGLSQLSKEEFKNTEYVSKINEFLNSKEFIDISKLGIKIVFITHAMFKKYDECFNIPPHIESGNNTPFQQLFIDSDILITDFSSTSFEFAYMNKPSIIFIPDIESVKSKYHRYNMEQISKYNHLYLHTNVYSLYKQILNFVENEQNHHLNDIFKYVDTKNSQRLISKIKDCYLYNKILN